MKNKSIMQMLELIAPKEAADGGAVEGAGAGTAGTDAEAGAGMSAAERLGRALLDSLGEIGGVSEDELADALLNEWSSAKAREEAPRGEADERIAPDEEYSGDGEASPFGESFPTPVPMRTGSSASAPVDYASMSAEQFNRLKKLLKKADADGRRIRI